ncbi:hypothetical protein MA16_Dca012542 [Dendrobium catenatum]|uniref:Uncharacterized protein n=1 Tax=Dendrobium catenatum TaxID=906689 RepID=A0A2I0W552_9ASPA|nr:hypothetical protein MA16_Dca012542 [Dendrobium catenatum]
MKKRRKKLLDHHQSLTGPPHESRWTTAGALPDHHRSFAGPPPELRRTTTGASPSPEALLVARPPSEALIFAIGPHIRLRPSPPSDYLLTSLLRRTTT